MSKCRSCGAYIIWVETQSGKRMPLSAESEEVRFFFLRDVDPDRPPSDEHVGAVKTYRSHFADCPDADDWRGGS